MFPFHWIFLLCLLSCVIGFPEICKRHEDCGKNATCGNNKQCNCNEGFIRLIDYKSRKITCTDCKCANCNLVNEDFKICFCKKGSIAVNGTCETELRETKHHNLEHTESENHFQSESNTIPTKFNVMTTLTTLGSDTEGANRNARAFQENTSSRSIDYLRETSTFLPSETEVLETENDLPSNTIDDQSDLHDNFSSYKSFKNSKDSNAGTSVTNLEDIDDMTYEQNLIITLGKIILVICALWLLIRFFRVLRKY